MSVRVTPQVDFSVQRGGFVAVVGEVGSGKTSLLMALMSELHATVGSVYVARSPCWQLCTWPAYGDH